MTTLAYLANARIPTEKAHGYQICKMCEAFAAQGAQVTLFHPFRRQVSGISETTSPFDYYGVRKNFEVCTLKNIDVLPIVEKYAPFLQTFLVTVQGLLWGFAAARQSLARKFDLYFTRDISCAFWLKVFGLPFIYECHDIPHRVHGFLLRRVARARSLRLCVALTSPLAERLRALGFDPNKIKISGDAVDLDLFSSLQARDECRKSLNLPPDVPIVGYVGRFNVMEREKGIPELVEAWAIARKKLDRRIVLLCVGGPLSSVGKYRDLCSRLGAPLDDLLFFDRVPPSEVPKWIRACDMAVIPWPWTEFSAYFTSPLKLFEYMAAGVPIVASDLPALKDVLTHRVNSWLVQPGKPAELADGIAALIQDKSAAASISERARADVESHTWLTRAQKILSAAAK